MIDPETGEEIELRSGAMPEGWHEQHDTGYIPGGADRMAERLLSQGSAHDAPDPNAPPRKWKGGGLPQGYGDARNRDGYDPRTGQ